MRRLLMIGTGAVLLVGLAVLLVLIAPRPLTPLVTPLCNALFRLRKSSVDSIGIISSGTKALHRSHCDCRPHRASQRVKRNL